MSASAALLERTYSVGAYAVTFTAPPRSMGDDVWCSIEWRPPRLGPINDVDLASFREARATFARELVEFTGEAVTVINH